jgi:hypothetical protein
MLDFFENIKRSLYPYTLKHLIIFLLTTAITTYITEYLLKYKLIKWIYVGIITVVIATLYNQGKSGKAAVDIFKLTTI